MENLTLSKNKLVRAIFSQVVDLGEFGGRRSDELHHLAFSEGWTLYYNIDCEESVFALNVWACLGLISRYEKDNFGEIGTSLDDPFRVANMVAYIWGEHLLRQSETYQQLEDEVLTEDILETIIAEISAYAWGKDESVLFNELCKAY